MKKNNSARRTKRPRLTLRRETIRVLNTELRAVLGGIVPTDGACELATGSSGTDETKTQ